MINRDSERDSEEIGGQKRQSIIKDNDAGSVEAPMKKAINYSPNPYGKVKKLIFKLFAVVFVFLIVLAIVINVRNN
jgi:hypothetical protein